MPVMTTTPRRLEGMIAVGKGSQVKPLGYISWFSLPQDPVKISTLRKAWGIAGLDPSPLPKDQRATDIFKRAMRQQERRTTNPDRTVTQTDVLDVLESKEEVVYQVSRVVRDIDEKVVEYPKALQAIFNKQHQSISFKPLVGVPKKSVLPMMNEIQDYYDHNAKTISGNKLRRLVRDYIQCDTDETSGRIGLSGENLRGQAGGVYFVLERFGESLDGLATALADLYPDGRAYLYSVPLADGATERELVRRHHAAGAIEDAKKEIEVVSKILREDRKLSVRNDVREHHWGVLRGMKRRVSMYGQALKGEEEEIGETMKLLERQLDKLIG